MKNGIIGSNSEKFFMAQHSSKGARFQAVTANRLLDGEVVYLAADNSWTEVFSEAEIADGPEAGEALSHDLNHDFGENLSASRGSAS